MLYFTGEVVVTLALRRRERSKALCEGNDDKLHKDHSERNPPDLQRPSHFVKIIIKKAKIRMKEVFSVLWTAVSLCAILAQA